MSGLRRRAAGPAADQGRDEMVQIGTVRTGAGDATCSPRRGRGGATIAGTRGARAPLSDDHRYDPEPCSAWPLHLIWAVGITYREAIGRGLVHSECLRITRQAYLAAGGEPAGAAHAVNNMIASLSRESGAWLRGAEDAWRLTGRPPRLDQSSPIEEQGPAR
jgi:hypothetical protein